MDSISKSHAKEIAALKLKKYRQKHQKFVVEGPNLVHEAQFQNKYKIDCIVATKDYYIKETPIATSFPRYIASAKQMKSISSLKTAYDCLAVLHFGEQPEFNFNLSALFLDGIQDPGNMGTIMRTAEWFGMQQILLSEECVDPFNNKSIQASAGSLYRTHIFTKSTHILKSASEKGLKLYGLDTNGLPLSTTNYDVNGIFVIGSEGRGISHKTQALLNGHLTIVPAPTNKAESLNAGISSAIFLADWFNKKSR